MEWKLCLYKGLQGYWAYNGKENGNYCSIGVRIWGYIGVIMENKMETTIMGFRVLLCALT